MPCTRTGIPLRSIPAGDGHVIASAEHLGKHLFSYNPRIDCTEQDVKEFLKQFKRIEALRLIPQLSRRLFNNKKALITLYNIPISNDILLYATKKIIQYTEDLQ